MTDGPNSMNGLIQGMKGLVVGSLSDALNELDMLNSCGRGTFTSHSSFRQFPRPSCRNTNNTFQWRSLSINGSDSLSSTSKENVEDISSPPLQSFHRSSNCRVSTKIMHPRIGRSRVTPYSSNRRPLYSLSGRSSSCSRLGCRRVSSFANTNTRSNSDPVCDYTESHNHSNSLSPNFMIPDLKMISYSNCPEKPEGLLTFGSLNDGLKRKTVNGSDPNPFPVPILTKSKSLEDLRESAKPKVKSLSSDMTSGSISSFEASSLIPCKSYQSNRAASIGSKIQHNNAFSSNRKTTESDSFINNEIDSMSELIQGLDVA